MERKHYGAIDGLRTIACIEIMMMHVKGPTVVMKYEPFFTQI